MSSPYAERDFECKAADATKPKTPAKMKGFVNSICFDSLLDWPNLSKNKAINNKYKL